MDRGRQSIGPKRFFGNVQDWKGSYGWINPSEKINHPLWEPGNGKLYVAAADIEGSQLKRGASVTFKVYKDNRGLGAFQCKLAGASKGASKGLPKWIMEGVTGGKGAPDASGLKAGRTRVKPTRESGKIKEKRADSKIGWITPKTPVKHKLAGPKGLFFHEDDIVPKGQKLEKGTEVTFFVYTDGKGVGAERIMEWKGTFMEAPKAKKEQKPSKGKGKGKSWGPIEKAFHKNKSIWKGAKPQKKLPRKRVTSEAKVGTVVEWKGTYGWLELDEPINHPKAKKNPKGHLYVRAEDVLTGSLSLGSIVNCHVYEDASGLGAEECIES